MNSLVCIVCGMTVNDKNYEFNKESFRTLNEADDVKYCPFCGVPAEYLTEGGKELVFDRNKLDDNALKIIDHAVKLEIFNGDFYKKASVIAREPEVKKMFEALSRIEFMHAKIHKKIGGFREDPILVDMDYSKYNSDDVLLEMACKREKHAVEYYERYSKEIEDEDIKKILLALSKVEEEHIELTDKEKLG